MVTIEELVFLWKVYLTFNVLCSIVGTIANLWFLLSILTSRTLRQRLRNQLICSLTLCHLPITLIKSPSLVWMMNTMISFDFPWTQICHLLGLQENLDFVQNGLGDWLAVLMISIYFARVLDFDLATKLTPGSVRICKIVMHLFPWALIAIATPVAVHVVGKWKCYKVHPSHYPLYMTFYTILPICLSILLLAVLCVLMWRRGGFGQGASATAGNPEGEQQLVGQTQEKDKPFAYMLLVGIAVACEMCELVSFFEISKGNYRGVKFSISALILSDSRVVLTLLPWLLLPDIRQRIKSWRPWRPFAQGREVGTVMSLDHQNDPA